MSGIGKGRGVRRGRGTTAPADRSDPPVEMEPASRVVGRGRAKRTAQQMAAPGVSSESFSESSVVIESEDAQLNAESASISSELGKAVVAKDGGKDVKYGWKSKEDRKLRDHKKPSLPPVEICQRPSVCTFGRLVKLLANHFLITIGSSKKGEIVEVEQYDVSITVDSGRQAVTKEAPRANGQPQRKPKEAKRWECWTLFWKAVRQHPEVFGPDSHHIFYDCQKTMYALQLLPWVSARVNQASMEVVHSFAEQGFPEHPQLFSVSVSHVGRVDISQTERVYDSNFMLRDRDCLHALDVLLRQGRLADDGLLSSLRSFYLLADDVLDLGCGRKLHRGFYTSTRVISGWQNDFTGVLSLNVDTTASAFYDSSLDLVEYLSRHLFRCQANTVLDRMSEQQRKDGSEHLRGLLIKTKHLGHKFKCWELSQLTANTHSIDYNGQRTSIADYYQLRHNITLQSPDLPLVSQNEKRSFPMELCRLADKQRVPLNRLSPADHSKIIRHTAMPPAERKQKILEMLHLANFQRDPRLEHFHIQIGLSMAKVDGRVLDAPRLQYYDRKPLHPQNGSWNMAGGTKFYTGVSVDSWLVVIIRREDRVQYKHVIGFVKTLMRVADEKGLRLAEPNEDVVEIKDPRDIQQIFSDLQKKYLAASKPLQLILAFLPSQSGGIYGEVKRVGEHVVGVATQCLKCERLFKESEQTLANICLKINAKLGGINNGIFEDVTSKNRVLFEPILLIGADVTHPDPGDRRSPSIAAVVGNMDNHPQAYQAVEQVQQHRKEIITGLEAAVEELLRSYERETGRIRKSTGLRPCRIIVYRDGVSESQFGEVLTNELPQIQRACKAVQKDGFNPSITFIIVQKRHHTRFFNENIDPRAKPAQQNISPGTVVDRGVVHPAEFDFFLCSHSGIQGTSKPTHYHVLYDDSKFSADELQSLTYDLCHTYARATKAVSLPAPVYYAHLVAFRARQRYQCVYQRKENEGVNMDEWVKDIARMQQDIAVQADTRQQMYWQ